MKCKKWVVAVSGGPDSMALLDKLHNKGYDCIVAHVNYHMRESSDQEEKMVENFCNRHNIRFHVAHYTHVDQGNFQHHARNFRYEFFARLVSKEAACGVAVGHHWDDDLETYVFQKERLMDSQYLGLNEISTVKGVKVWRPLLHDSKEDLVSYCEMHEIPYAVDQSNLSLDYTRNRIRHKLTHKDLLYTQLSEERKFHKQKQAMIQDCVESFKEPIFEREDYLGIDESIRSEVLRGILVESGLEVFKYSSKFFKELDRQIEVGSLYHDFGALNLYCSYNKVALLKPKAYQHTFTSLHYGDFENFKITQKGTTMQGVTLSSEDFPITVRNWQKGDKIKMRFGSKSVHRFLIDRKIPQYERESWLVVENAVKDIIFVMGMGCDVHHYTNNPNAFMIELILL